MARRPTTPPPDLEQLARIARASKQRLGQTGGNAPTQVGELLAGTQRRSAERAGMAVDLGLWRAVVGNRIADRTQPGRLKDGVLTVRVSSAVWAQELSLMGDELVARLRSAGVPLATLKFAVSGARPRLPAPEPKASRAPRAPLPAELRERLEQVEDPDLRQAIGEAASLSLGAQNLSAKRPAARDPRSVGPKTAPRVRGGRRRT